MARWHGENSIVGKKNILLPSDRDGFMHLYLYDMNGKLLRQVEKGNYPAARKFFAECPSPIVLTPFEIGKQVVYPGRSIAEDFGWAEHHPMVEAYKAYHEMPYDRPTWDVIATYYVLPHEPSSLTLSIPGRITVDEQGFIFFTPDKAGQHRYITASDRQAGMILGYFLRALPERPLRYMR